MFSNHWKAEPPPQYSGEAFLFQQRIAYPGFQLTGVVNFSSVFWWPF